MSESSTADVLICGAGAAGLTLAIDLARRGVRVRVIERLSEPFPGSRGKAIQPRTLEVLEDLGVVDDVAALGGLYPPQREYRDDGTHQESDVMEHGVATPAEPYPAPLMVAQFLTEGVLRRRLATLGVVPELGCELVGFEQDAVGVDARLVGAGGEEALRVHYLVGADGGRSFVRHALDVGFPGKTLGVRAVVADLVLPGLSRDVWHRFGKGPGSMSLCPLMGTELIQLQAPVSPEGDVDLSAEGLGAMITERTGRADLRVHAVSWASAFTPGARLADHYRVGRVFLAGDAAHTHPPTGGQGLNTSIQDAYNLGWKLASVLAGAPDALLDTYEEERRPIAAEMLGLSTQLLDAIKRGELRRGRDVQQLDLGYPESSLAVEAPARSGGVLAGDRAPDAPVLGAGGQPRRLFTLFEGPHWTLLGMETPTGVITPRPGLRIHHVGPQGDLRDIDGHVAAAYGLSAGDWALVRPDGYLGAIVGAGELAVLEDYLERMGL